MSVQCWCLSYCTNSTQKCVKDLIHWLSGNRGWRLEIWDSTAILNLDKLDEIADMNETLDGYNVSYVEEAKYTYTNDRHVARLSGYFVAPDSGKFTFYIMGKHLAKMYFTAQDTRVCTGCGVYFVLSFVGS